MPAFGRRCCWSLTSCRWILVLAVSEGVVFIDGFVETLKEKRRIGKIAARERGVLEVHNNLTVVSVRVKNDEDHTERIRSGTRKK